LTQLKSSNPSISAVTNLLAASGASNADTALTARRRAPRTATTLSRIVSLTDYDDFVQSFAGVGRARTSLLWNGATQVVHITFLGADQQEIPADSLLYRSLSQAIDAVRELSRKVVLQSGSNLIRSFDVEASLVLAPGRRAEQVLPVARTGLVRAFAFDRRAFGAGVALSEVIGVLQNVAGVLAVDMHALNVEGTTRALHTYVSVDLAHWDPAGGAFVPDQLLVINANDGIHLDVQPGA
jgi:predicted phage baseplate assembly protein